LSGDLDRGGRRSLRGNADCRGHVPLHFAERLIQASLLRDDITAGGAQADEVERGCTSVLSDLPVTLVARVPRLADKALFRRLVDLSDRVVIDSANFRDQEADLASMAAVLRDTPRWTALSDLNWARLTAWRALLASFYDISDYRPLLDQLKQVTIRYAPPAKDSSVIPTRALLLAGWLASRLRWSVQQGSTKRTKGSTSLELSVDDRSFDLEFAHTVATSSPPSHAGYRESNATRRSHSLEEKRGRPAHRDIGNPR
jgi:glucose-6-phosphate dehydrogenase assembly protein OpcA